MLKEYLKKSAVVILEFAFIAGAFWYILQKKDINIGEKIAPALTKTIENVQTKATLPEPAGKQTASFVWEYKGKKYSLDLALYDSIYQFYKIQPKEYSYTGTLQPGWEEEYYAMFLNDNFGDSTVSNLAKEIQDLGKKQKLSDDQIVDLVVAFVQSIPYDDEKAKNIVANSKSESMRYSYETLFEKKGVCSDKSILAYGLLSSLGYGTTLMAYEQNNHMAVGVQCPKSYSTYGSGYCYAETTSTGNKIGIVPNIDTESNKAIDLSSLDPNQIQKINLQELGQVSMFASSTGKEYSGIIETKKIANEVERLKDSLKTLLAKIKTQKNAIEGEAGDLEDMKDWLDGHKDGGEIEKYNSTAKKYNDLVETYQKDVKEYNNNVNLYNQYVQKYNALIRQ